MAVYKNVADILPKINLALYIFHDEMAAALCSESWSFPGKSPANLPVDAQQMG